jgi:putative FmdB family regulatory protein
MPTYEYACDACGHAFEEFQSITAAPLRKCPSCAKSKLRRLISSGGGLIFKGSGFYITDYRSDSYKKAAEAETKSASGGGDKPEAKKAEPAKEPSPKPAPEKKAPAPGKRKKGAG